MPVWRWCLCFFGEMDQRPGEKLATSSRVSTVQFGSLDRVNCSGARPVPSSLKRSGENNEAKSETQVCSMSFWAQRVLCAPAKAPDFSGCKTHEPKRTGHMERKQFETKTFKHSLVFASVTYPSWVPGVHNLNAKGHGDVLEQGTQ